MYIISLLDKDYNAQRTFSVNAFEIVEESKTIRYAQFDGCCVSKKFVNIELNPYGSAILIKVTLDA